MSRVQIECRKIWDNTNSRKDFCKAEAILRDYVRPTGKSDFFSDLGARLMAGHWNRHHLQKVYQVLTKIREREIVTIEQLLDQFSLVGYFDGKTKADLYERVTFIARQCNTAIPAYGTSQIQSLLPLGLGNSAV